MAGTLKKSDYAEAFTFTGLLAGEGLVPGVESGSTDKVFLLMEIESCTKEIVSNLTAEGDFFMLMTEAGMMKTVEPAKPWLRLPKWLRHNHDHEIFVGDLLAH